MNGLGVEEIRCHRPGRHRTRKDRNGFFIAIILSLDKTGMECRGPVRNGMERNVGD